MPPLGPLLFGLLPLLCFCLALFVLCVWAAGRPAEDDGDYPHEIGDGS